MTDFSSLSLSQLIAPQRYPCACGKVHASPIHQLLIEPGAIRQLADTLLRMNVHHPFVVMDFNTREAAGHQALALLDSAAVAYRACTLSHPLPNEEALGAMAMQFTPDCDFVLAIGSGVINDLCKMLGYVTGRATGVLATAPSMDGYASNSSAMETGGVKTTLYNQSPQMILCDIDVLQNAPYEMLLSGLGDMMAKRISICEWRIAHLLTGEYYCESVADMMRTALDKVLASAGDLPARSPEAVQQVTEGLVLSGIAMSYAGISRPASGLEHTFSHLWEMIALARGRRPAPHGIQVGFGTWLTLRLYRFIATLQPKVERAAQQEADLPLRLGAPIAQTLRASVEQDPYHMRVVNADRQRRLAAHWPEIQAIIAEELHDSEFLLALMERLDMPRTPEALGLSSADVMDAFWYSRYLRPRYITTSYLWDAGLLDLCADYLQNEVL